MRELKKLELEYEGIRSSISKYTSDGSVINFLDGLKEQLKKNDAEAISYYTEEICKWYDLNITEIHNTTLLPLEDSSHYFVALKNYVLFTKIDENYKYRYSCTY